MTRRAGAKAPQCKVTLRGRSLDVQQNFEKELSAPHDRSEIFPSSTQRVHRPEDLTFPFASARAAINSLAFQTSYLGFYPMLRTVALLSPAHHQTCPLAFTFFNIFFLLLFCQGRSSLTCKVLVGWGKQRRGDIRYTNLTCRRRSEPRALPTAAKSLISTQAFEWQWNVYDTLLNCTCGLHYKIVPTVLCNRPSRWA